MMSIVGHIIIMMIQNDVDIPPDSLWFLPAATSNPFIQESLELSSGEFQILLLCEYRYCYCYCAASAL